MWPVSLAIGFDSFSGDQRKRVKSSDPLISLSMPDDESEEPDNCWYRFNANSFRSSELKPSSAWGRHNLHDLHSRHVYILGALTELTISRTGQQNKRKPCSFFGNKIPHHNRFQIPKGILQTFHDSRASSSCRRGRKRQFAARSLCSAPTCWPNARVRSESGIILRQTRATL